MSEFMCNMVFGVGGVYLSVVGFIYIVAYGWFTTGLCLCLFAPLFPLAGLLHSLGVI